MNKRTGIAAWLAIVSVGAMSLSASGAEGSGPRRFVALDQSLALVPVEVEAFAVKNGRAEVRVVPVGAASRTGGAKGMGPIVALLPADWFPDPRGMTARMPAQASEGPRRWLELTDGQVLVGDFGESAEPATPTNTTGASTGAATEAKKTKPDAAAVAWISPMLGSWRVDLERVARCAVDPDAPGTAAGGSSDRVLLRNGDRVEGFIEALGSTIRVDAGAKAGGARAIESALVSEVVMGSPMTPARGTWAELSDGSRVLAGEATITSAGTRLEMSTLAGAASAQVGMDEVVALVPEARSVRALAEVPIARQRSSQDRLGPGEPSAVAGARGPGAVLGARDVVIPGPMEVEWTLPRGAAGVSGVVQMDERSWSWGECVVVIEVDAGRGWSEKARLQLSGEAPSFPVALKLEGAGENKLRVRVEPGLRGPIQDRVVLRRMLLVMGPGSGT